MIYALEEIDAIRRWRKSLMWIFSIFALASSAYLFAGIGEAFLGRASPRADSSPTNPILAICPWAVFVAFRRAKVLSLRLCFCGTATALMFLPLFNLAVMVFTAMRSGRVLAAPKISW